MTTTPTNQALRDKLIASGAIIPDGGPLPALPLRPDVVVFRIDERGRKAAAEEIRRTYSVRPPQGADRWT